MSLNMNFNELLIFMESLDIDVDEIVIQKSEK